jgi:hypothetical protein
MAFESTIIASLLAQQLFDKTFSEAYSLLRKRVSDARDEYKAKPPEELLNKLENSRRMCLDEISELQTRSIISLSNQVLLQRIVAVLLELTAEAYEAKLEQELDSIHRRTEQLKSLLNRQDRDKNYRVNVRLIAVVVSIVSFVLLFLLAIFSPRIGLSVSTLIPVLQIPLAVLLWSALGSFTSLVYRFNTASDLELQDPLRWLVTRPLTGIVMGIIAFLVMKVGLLTTSSTDVAASLGTNELMWLVAFLAGFSDRFSEGILRNAVGRLGGDKSADLFAPTAPASGLDLVELFQSAIKRKKEPAQESKQPQVEQVKAEPGKMENETDEKQASGLSSQE